MIYAKLYPDSLVEGYRAAMRGLYGDFYNADELPDPSSQDWAAFAASCNLRDMGTHICALPTGQHCSRGLVCLGCHHAQPKKSAAPTFRRMIASHTRALAPVKPANPPDNSPRENWKSNAYATPSRAPTSSPKLRVTRSKRRPFERRPAGWQGLLAMEFCVGLERVRAGLVAVSVLGTISIDREALTNYTLWWYNATTLLSWGHAQQ